MICEDLLSIKQLNKGLKFLGGKEGLTRSIRWIYFADCMECLDEKENPAEWIYGGELIVVTNESLTGNEQKFLALMRAVNTKNVAGFIINVGQVPDTAISLAEELAIPIFEISWSLRLVDLSQILCKALIEEENYENSLDHILFTILYADNMAPSALIYQAKYYGVDLQQKCRMLVFDIDNFGAFIRENKIKDEGAISEIKNVLTKAIKREFRMAGIKNVMTLLQSDSANVLIPSNSLNEESLIEVLHNIRTKFSSACHGLTLTIGIGNSYEYIDEMKLSLQEANKAIEISHIKNTPSPIIFYKDTGIYSLLMQIDNGRVLDNYYMSHLEPLMEVDKLQEGNLCKTLETYLKCNCNANAAADQLFIHRNTMRYRLDKIKSILGKEITDTDACMELNLAFHIKKYRNKLHKTTHSNQFVLETQSGL